VYAEWGYAGIACPPEGTADVKTRLPDYLPAVARGPKLLLGIANVNVSKRR